MSRARRFALIGLGILLAPLAGLVRGEELVRESARQIPVAASVDVLVVGGSTGAVAAAVEAARAGAQVFLAAGRPYLGDDMTATLRLWLEPGEHPVTPLAIQLFQDPDAATGLAPKTVEYSYQTDPPSAARHRDTNPPSLLCDRAFGQANHESVEYDGDVNVTLDLHGPHEVAQLRLWAFQNASSYRVSGMTVWASDDQQQWTEMAQVQNPSDVWEARAALTADLGRPVRFLKVLVKKSPKMERVLLGEIELIAPSDGPLPPAQRPWPRPMHVKRTLDEALATSGVQFLYNCYPTELLSDAQGQPCGIVIADRAGRQAVLAKTIIDATDRATVARLAGATFRPYPAGPQTFHRVVIGGKPAAEGEGIQGARIIDPPFGGPYPNRAKTESGLFSIIEYTLRLPMADDSDAAWARADQQARTLTYHPEQQFTSDVLSQVPPNPMFGQGAAGPLAAFRPKRVERLLVLSGFADVPRQEAETLLGPLALMDLGTRLGAAAAEEARSLPAPQGAKLRGSPAGKPAAAGDVAELLRGLRPGSLDRPSTIPAEARWLPVVGRYDVVVIGGGTAGAPAGIAAARQGAKTLVVEQQSGLGGVGTLGAISSYCQGNRVGFTAEVGGGDSWIIEQKMEWWRSELVKAGADVWFGTIGCGAFTDAGVVRGAVIVGPRGRGVVLARVVVDATGNADVAAAAGAPCMYTDETEFAIQGTGLPPRELGAAYRNSDFAYTDDNDPVDVWHLLFYAKERYPKAFDLGKLVDTRERRRIVGEALLTINDIVTERTYPDSIARTHTSLDTHGYTIDPFFLLRHPDGHRFTCYVPYRCLLPKGLEGLLVTGIGLSAHRDAQPIVRMQPDVQNQGYAAGAAAALAAKSGKPLRQIDVRALQKHLVEIGNLPESVLTDVDSHPLPASEVAAAVQDLGEFRSLAVVLDQPDVALPLLQKAYQAATDDEKKLLYAKTLGMLGDATGLATLLEQIRPAKQWDSMPDWRADKNAPGFERVGWSLSHLDNTLVAIGHTRRAEAVPEVLKMLGLLTPRTTFSHHRAVYMALECLGNPAAAQPLAEMLQRSDMHGYAVTSLDQRDTSDKTRQTANRELALARALYRCGDWEGQGEATLREYTGDLRGQFARHAQAVLAAGKEYRP